MADGRHFENSFIIAICQPEIIRFKWNLVRSCRLCFQGRLLNKILKFCKFKMADGRHIENRLLAISQRINTRINAKFCRIKQNHGLTQHTWPKYQISKIQHGGRPPSWKWFYRYISAGNHPISMQFSVQPQSYASKDGHMTKCHNFGNSTWQTAAIMKIAFRLYLDDLFSD